MTHFSLASTFLLAQAPAAAADNMPNWIVTFCGMILCLFLGLLGGTIIWFIWTNKINLCSLLSEANGDASLSRFQLLVFTFVIAFSFFYLVEKNPNHEFPNIPEGVLTLLGISASTYAIGKGISYSRDEGVLTDDQIADKNQTVQVQAQAQAVQAQAAAQSRTAQAVVQVARDVAGAAGQNPER